MADAFLELADDAARMVPSRTGVPSAGRTSISIAQPGHRQVDDAAGIGAAVVQRQLRRAERGVMRSWRRSSGRPSAVLLASQVN